MPISIQPPPAEGGLAPSGTPPSVEVTITMPLTGGFTATLSTPSGPVVIESGYLPGGSTHVRIFLPTRIPAGSSLVVSAWDATGLFSDFSYSL